MNSNINNKSKLILIISIVILYIGCYNCETPTLPTHFSGVIDPHFCLTNTLYTANPTPNNQTLINNAEVKISWYGKGNGVNTTDYCRGCYAEEATTIPTLLRATNHTNGTYIWHMIGNETATPIPCTVVANCTNFWTTQWPYYKGSLTGTQCVECSHGYCRGGAEMDNTNTTVITNPATCSGFEPIKTTFTNKCITELGVIGKLTANIYTRLYTNIDNTCDCQQKALSLSGGSIKWRLSIYNNATIPATNKCCALRPTCDYTRPSLFGAIEQGVAPINNTVITFKGGDYATPASRMGSTDVYPTNSIISCTYSSDCDRSTAWQTQLNYTFNNFTNILFGYDSLGTTYGVVPIGASCLESKCFPVYKNPFAIDSPIGWDDNLCAPSFACSYGLHDIYLPPGSTSFINLNSSLFDVPFMNPCSGTFGVGEIISVSSLNCPSSVTYDNITGIYKLVAFIPPAGTKLPLACTLNIECNATLGYYDCDGSGPNARGSIYNTYYIGTAPLTIAVIIAIIVGVIIFIVLAVLICVYCIRSKPIYRGFPEDVDDTELYLIKTK